MVIPVMQLNYGQWIVVPKGCLKEFQQLGNIFGKTSDSDLLYVSLCARNCQKYILQQIQQMLTQVQVQGIQWHQCSERIWKLQPQSVHVLNKRLRESGQASCAKSCTPNYKPNRIHAPVKHTSSPNRCKRVWSIRPKQCWTSLAILMTY